MGVMGVVVVAVVSGGAMLKGLLAATVGMAVASVGTDPGLGLPRFVPESIPYLLGGFNLIIVVIGIFALPEIMGLIIENRSIASDVSSEDALRDINEGRWKGMRAVMRNKFLVFRSVVLGVIVGVMPGIGGSVVDWLTYAQARATEKGAAETFGTGDIRGVIAPESANNATSAAQLIPTLALGIPGGAYQAVYLGFFLLLGFQPGPRFLDNHMDIVFLIVFSLLLANVFGTVMLLFLSKYFARIAFISPHILAPIILAILLVAAFTSRNSYWDLGLLMVVSAVGWHMKRYGWPRPPLIIGFVLGPILERYLARTLGSYDNLWDALTRIPSLTIIAVALGIAFYSAKLAREAQASAGLMADKAKADIAETSPTSSSDGGA
jgi:TctA family transporter